MKNRWAIRTLVSVISDSNNLVVATVPLDDSIAPFGAYDSGKGEIFVTNNEDYMISVISDSTNTVVANVTLPEGALRLLGHSI